MRLEDYIKYYPGQPALVETIHDGIVKTEIVAGGSGDVCYVRGFGNTVSIVHCVLVTPILRPLSSMTEEEALAVSRFHTPDFQPTAKQSGKVIEMIRDRGMEALSFDDTPTQVVFNIVHYLLSCGFDLFGLIPAGLAVDAESIDNTKK